MLPAVEVVEVDCKVAASHQVSACFLDGWGEVRMLDCIDQPLGGCAGEVVVEVAGSIVLAAAVKPVLNGRRRRQEGRSGGRLRTRR